MKTPINEQILSTVSDELIRPLLALSMRALRPSSIETYKQLLREVKVLRSACSSVEESLLCRKLDMMISLRMYAMLDAQKWAQKQGHTAEAIGVYINRWQVEMLIDGENREYLVSYVDDGVDKKRMERKVKPLIIEAAESDLASVMDG